MARNILLLVLLGSAVEASSDSPCCFPPVFQTTWYTSVVTTLEHGTGMNITYVNLGLWSDYSTKQDAMTFSYLGQEDNAMKTINDYKKGKAYFIEHFGTSKERCDVYDNPSPMERVCLPDGTQFLESIFYGAGNKTLHVDRYQFVNTKDKVLFYFTMQKDHCIPVERAEIQQSEGQIAAAGGAFLDFGVKISDPSVFTPPDSCTHKNRLRATKSWNQAIFL